MGSTDLPARRSSRDAGQSVRTASADGVAAGTTAAVRVADVLLLFIEGPDSVGVSAIARKLALSKAVVHRILQSLAAREIVVFDPEVRAYRLGPAAVALGARALRDSDLRRAALPVLRRLRDATGETTTLSERLGDHRVYVDQFESPNEIRMLVEIGRRFPLHAGGSSKVILAHLPSDQRELILTGPLPALTPRTVTSAEQLRAQLEEIRANGYAISRGERQTGAGSVAAPLFGVDGDVVGAISVCGPVSRFDEAANARFVPLVLAAAEEISRSLGWLPGQTSASGPRVRA